MTPAASLRVVPTNWTKPARAIEDSVLEFHRSFSSECSIKPIRSDASGIHSRPSRVSASRTMPCQCWRARGTPISLTSPTLRATSASLGVHNINPRAARPSRPARPTSW